MPEGWFGSGRLDANLPTKASDPTVPGPGRGRTSLALFSAMRHHRHTSDPTGSVVAGVGAARADRFPATCRLYTWIVLTKVHHIFF